ncbi:uncharacterized protein LOC123314734 [Coccinella septempunctata]|uniref:uncharacterized protein LOC123314734 n=1 Tax=Coccinella septempunctata TaxID=41139 RepID=UPI001D07272A|nr:uncharacterized protein LOC123314734 [Coccinella septempunctata]
MINLKFVFLFCASSGLVQAQQRDLPKYIEKCSLKHEFKQCVLRSANKAIPLIVKGDADYKIPNMQPLHVPFVNLFNTPQIVLNFTDTKVYGLENAKMVDIVVNNEDRLSFTAAFENPNITLSGEYSIIGTILALPLKGDGLYSVSLCELTSICTYVIRLFNFSVLRKNHMKFFDF